MDLKKPIPIAEQLIKCKNDGLKTSNDLEALKILSHVGYYKLMGYAFQFVKGANGHKYSDDASFELVYKIYCFDCELRDLLRKYLETIEVYYKSLISNTFSLRVCKEPPYDQHYDSKNYYRKEYFNEISEAFKKENEYYKESAIVKHHQNKYGGKMPLWALLELLSFSNTSKLYGSMYDGDQDAIASIVGISRNTLENHLHCLSVLRNKCSHAARLYNTNMNPGARLTVSFLKKHPSISSRSLFAYVIVLNKRLPDDNYRSAFKKEFVALINKCRNYIDLSLIGVPEDYESILK